ncbi:MAG: hypothetical protein HOY71_35830, partial [Nonomuraea sp.]|nr:hypothetical protein [Nonomuraea sp.]
DSTVIFDQYGLDRRSATFSEQLDAGEREQAIHPDPSNHRALQLALVPIVGKRIARRSPETAPMVEFVGGPHAPDATWTVHIATLRQLLGGFEALGLADSVAAGHAYLDLVEETFDWPPWELRLELIGQQGEPASLRFVFTSKPPAELIQAPSRRHPHDRWRPPHPVGPAPQARVGTGGGAPGEGAWGSSAPPWGQPGAKRRPMPRGTGGGATGEGAARLPHEASPERSEGRL